MKNILRETDSYNTALQSKEPQDAKRQHPHNEGDTLQQSGRSSGLIDEDEHRYKRRRKYSDYDQSKSYLDSEEPLSERVKNYDSKNSRRATIERDEECRGQPHDGYRHKHHHHHRHRHRHHSSRKHATRTLDDRYDRESQSIDVKHHIRSRSPSKKGKRKHYNEQSEEQRFRASISPKGSTAYTAKKDKPTKTISSLFDKHKGSESLSGSLDSDSDPLGSIIGPLPPPPAQKIRIRGRGTFASSTAIDSHFSSKYDPSQDIHPNSESENDWDQALEALRDRQRWKQQGADRLRSAGFSEEEIQKWQRGGEKGEEDVKWKGKGEGREWDRGKVVSDEGIETKPEWGRLKGT